MWKLIVIYINRYMIMEGDELDLRTTFNLAEYSHGVLFAFLYDDKHHLAESYISSARKLKRD